MERYESERYLFQKDSRRYVLVDVLHTPVGDVQFSPTPPARSAIFVVNLVFFRVCVVSKYIGFTQHSVVPGL